MKKINRKLKPNAAYFMRMTQAALDVAEAARAELFTKGRHLCGEVSRAAFEKAKRKRKDAVARYALLSIGVDPDMKGNEITWWARHVVQIVAGPRKTANVIAWAKRNGIITPKFLKRRGIRPNGKAR